MNLTDLEIAKCSIRSCVLRDCEIAGGLFDNVAFIDCDLSNSVFTLSGFRRCELIDCKLIGADLSETVFENVLMRGCSASLVSFSHSKWKEVRIQDCDFVGADMGEMDLSRVSLIGSRFTGANLFKTGLAGIDLTSCNIEGITISDSLTELRGCKMDINQMDTFARMLGILLDC